MMDGGDPKHPANQPPAWEGVLIPVPLRVYLAAQALNGLLASPRAINGSLEITPPGVVQLAYAIADEMIRQSK